MSQATEDVALRRNLSPLPTMQISPTFQFGTAVTCAVAGSVGEPSGSASR